MMQRISIIGTSASGKTTLARELSRRLNIAHIELDSLHWGPNWTPTPTEILRPRVIAATAGNAWAMEGNYKSLRDVVWDRADTIIWLDYSLPLVCARVLRRTWRRCWTRELLWNGCRESFLLQLSKNSIFLWVLSSWRRHRQDYPKLLRQQAALGKRVLRFRTPIETERWLASLPPPSLGC